MEVKKIADDMRKKLREPLQDSALKAITTKPHLSSINPIYVVERLNDVFGIGSWNLKSELCAPISSEQKTSAKGRLYTEFTSLIKVTLTIQEYGIHLECIAGSTNEDEGDAAKGGISDCINKIASWLEIGIDIYKGNQSHNKQLPQTGVPKQTQVPIPEEKQEELKTLIGMPAEKEVVELYWAGKKGSQEKMKQFEEIYPNLELVKSETGKWVFQPKGFYKGVKK